MPAYFLGLDIGIEGLKAVVMDGTGQVIGEDIRGWSTRQPRKGWFEQEADRWTRSSLACVAGAVRHAGIGPEEILGVGVSGGSEGLVAVGGDGAPLRDAIVGLDQRATPQCVALAEKISRDEIVSLTGLNISPLHMLPKILWIKENEPEVFGKAKRFVQPATFLLNFITDGVWAADVSSASGTMLLDSNTGDWSKKILEAVGLDKPSLASVVPCGAAIGECGGEFARMTGLRTDTPVAGGAAFEQAAALGVGITGPGVVCDIVSLYEPVCALAPEAFLDKTRLMETRAAADGRHRFAINPGFISGGNYKWLADNFGMMEKLKTADMVVRTEYDLLTEQAAKAPAGADGVIFFPFMMGAMAPEWNPHARGMLAGFTMAQGRNHIIRAILEGAAYALRDVVERMRECGMEVNEIRIMGGSSRSRLMEKIRADVTGVSIRHPNTPETAPYGAALLGAVAAGHFKDAAEAASACVHIVHTHDPDPENKKIYDDMYAKYRLIYDRLKNDFANLWG